MILACKYIESLLGIKLLPSLSTVIKELHRFSGNAISMRSLYVVLSIMLLAMDPDKLRGYLNSVDDRSMQCG